MDSDYIYTNRSKILLAMEEFVAPLVLKVTGKYEKL